MKEELGPRILAQPHGDTYEGKYTLSPSLGGRRVLRSGIPPLLLPRYHCTLVMWASKSK